MQRQLLSDFKAIGGRFFPLKYEQLPLLVFTFVRGRGNKLINFLKIFQPLGI